MAETLISPGVLARENDQSQITSQPIQAGAALVGPTVKGQVNIPKLITTYSEYQANFGTTFDSGSDEYTFLTSISAYNYFQNGGTSLIVTRVASGSFSSATSSTIFNDQETGDVLLGTNLLGSWTSGGENGAAFENTVTPSTSGTGTGIVLAVTASNVNGKLVDTADALLGSITTNTTTAGAGSYSVNLTNGSGTGAVATVVVTGTTAPTVTGITVTTSGSGYIATNVLTIPAGALGTGQLITGDDILAETAATPIGNVTGPFTVAQSSTSGTGTGATIAITGDGANALSAVSVVDIGTGYVVNDTITITAADLITAGFAGAAGDLVVTVSAGMLQDSTAVEITLIADDIFVETVGVQVTTAGSGYAVGDTLTVAAADMGNPSAALVLTLVDADILDANAFTLETIGEGIIMNSDGALASNGVLTNGTSDNIRWEIVSPNTSSGTFSVIIRQGNDTTRAKSVLESFNNVSLDPKASNYISRIIGDQKQVVRGSGTDVYLQTSGSYANASRYVRVKSVAYKTPDYLDNAGNAKSVYTASIPVAASGAFGDAVGTILTGTGNYYQYIDGNDTQGLKDGNYTTAFNLLANKDDYKYNIISSPGLYQSGYSSILNTLISNTENRGDNIVVLDLEPYASSITAVTSTATAQDTSYAASYWPWCMVTDPDSGQRVWVPASTLIPGVYANNDRTAEAWFAPAGINRGGLGQVLQAERKLTQANRDTLYTGKVNPIATFPGRGVVVFGQKTLQNQASALDRVNVRRLLIALKNYISQISDNLVFEQNTAATRNIFLSQVNPYLESVQQRQGLYAFKVVMNDSNNGPDVIDRNELRGAIYIQPTKTAEFIYLDFNILPTGAEFPA
jgi:phage tail sheath protein FI